MTTDRNDDCSTCPRCRLREQLTATLSGDERGAHLELLLEQLLDTVEAVRAVELADDDDEEDLVAEAVEELVLTVDRVQQAAAGDDQEDD